MNTGALRLQEEFPEFGTLSSLCARVTGQTWAATNPDYPALENSWTAFHFYAGGKETEHARTYPEIEKVRAFFQCPVEELMFYALHPGAKIHPHRDMSGNLPLGRLRFHVPVVTNPNVEFIVGGHKLRMGQGELWALDTSYKHSLHNYGNEIRIHCVVQVVVNAWVLSMLPRKSYGYYSHVAAFWSIASVVGAKKIFSDPAFLSGNMRYVINRLRE